MPRVSLLPLLPLALAGAAGIAGAAEPPPPSPCEGLSDARRLVEEGLRLYKAGFALTSAREARTRYEQSLRCYDLAIERSQSPGKIYHPLGLVYEKLDRPGDALEAYQRFLAEVPEAERSPQVSQKLRERVEALKAQMEGRGKAPPLLLPPITPPPGAGIAPAGSAPAGSAVTPAPAAAPPPPIKVAAPRREPRWGLIAAGSSIFGGMYLLSVLGGALCDPYDCGPQGFGLYIPLIGPFIAMGSYRGYDDYAAVEAVMFIDGFLQLGGVAMVVAGAVFKRPVPALSFSPMPGGGGALSYSARF